MPTVELLLPRPGRTLRAPSWAINELTSRQIDASVCSSLKEVNPSRGFSSFFFLVCPVRDIRSAPKPKGFFFECLSCVVLRVGPAAAKRTNSQVDCSRSVHRVRSQSFFSWRLHP